MKPKLIFLSLCATLLLVPAGAEARARHHHHARHHAVRHHRAHRADVEVWELVSGSEYMPTPQEEAEDQAAVEAYEDGPTPREEEEAPILAEL